MERIHVFSDERPSNRSGPLLTPSQVSWTTSSATARSFTYTGNAAGGISAFAIGRDGSLAARATTNLLPSPRDLDFDQSGRYLHAISPGTAATGGQVTTYRVGSDGSLSLVDTVPAAAGITGAAAM